MRVKPHEFLDHTGSDVGSQSAGKHVRLASRIPCPSASGKLLGIRRISAGVHIQDNLRCHSRTGMTYSTQMLPCRSNCTSLGPPGPLRAATPGRWHATMWTCAEASVCALAKAMLRSRGKVAHGRMGYGMTAERSRPCWQASALLVGLSPADQMHNPLLTARALATRKTLLTNSSFYTRTVAGHGVGRMPCPWSTSSPGTSARGKLAQHLLLGELPGQRRESSRSRTASRSCPKRWH